MKDRVYPKEGVNRVQQDKTTAGNPENYTAQQLHDVIQKDKDLMKLVAAGDMEELKTALAGRDVNFESGTLPWHSFKWSKNRSGNPLRHPPSDFQTLT